MIKIKIVNNTDSYQKLSVFDFDGTLFKSPDRPKGFKGNWWISKESLGEPHVPRNPEDNYWNLSIVKKAQDELKNSNNLCILLTGRIGILFEDRVKDLISQKSLSFPIVKLNEFGEETENFKIAEIQRLLKKYPSIKKIEFWDDDKEKVELYNDKFKNEYSVRINLI